MSACGAATTREQCIGAAAKVWARACVADHRRTPREAAEAAFQPGGPSVDELEQRVRAWRQQHAADSAA